MNRNNVIWHFPYLLGLLIFTFACATQHQSQEKVINDNLDSGYMPQRGTPNPIITQLVERYNSGQKVDVKTILDTLNICNPCPITIAPAIQSNYPNPFSAKSTIEFNVVEDSARVILMIYNIYGKLLDILFSGRLNKGTYQLYPDFNYLNYPSGIYFYWIKIGSHEENRKFTLLK